MQSACAVACVLPPSSKKYEDNLADNFSCCIDLALDSKSAANLNNFYGRIRKSGRSERSERARISERSRIVMVGH